MAKLIFKWIILIFIILVIVFILAFDVFYIPSGSMQNTIFPGDIILVKKNQNKIEQNSLIVFHFPLGDTIIEGKPNINYYYFKGNEKFKDSVKNYRAIYIPINKRQPFIKRCIALPGDTFELKYGQVYINNKYILNPYTFIWEKLKTITTKDIRKARTPKLSMDKKKFWENASMYRKIFPNNKLYKWDNNLFGPFIIPKKGITVKVDLTNIWLYKRIIEVYEGKSLAITKSGIYINNKLIESYTFNLNYYWVMGDNRETSNDSRFWGFVPENHIIGNAKMVLFSIENTLNGKRFRWNRLFKLIK
jgi:signal peptidase I